MARCLRLLTFDVTNTIVRVKGTPGVWYARAARDLGLPADSRRLDAVHGTVWRAMKKHFPHYGYRQGMTSKEWWAEFICRIFPAAGYVSHDADFYAELGEVLHEKFTGGHCYDTVPGARSMLEQFKRDGLSLGVVSNFDERLAGVLEGHGLLHYFDFLVTSISSQCDKPTPKIFRDALKVGQVAPNEAGHVGDDVTNDYWGAQKVGLTAFLFDPHRKLTNHDLDGVDPTCVFHDLSELPQITQRMLNG